ncbi:hypothetical protein ACQP1G_00550 [Nocardia sp. CA-107356]|uniref:hypothetical protein n=1 Tax=Nocardia sp. CA-107356 TaxID=3239972 RepID=UPI003D92D219
MASGAVAGLPLPSVAPGDTLVSLSRDSYVSGHGKDKLNAAFAVGGAPLPTIETATEVRIDNRG